jgi:CRP-like cAMP-binding protein
MSSVELTQSAEMARRVSKQSGASFFQQGDEADFFFVLDEGRVKMTQVTPDGHQVVLRYVSDGEMFGCVPLFGHRQYPAAATAVVLSTAYAWDNAATHKLMDEYPQIARNALQFLGDELYEIRQRFQELATERVEQRVARALLRLVRQSGRRVENKVLVDVPLTRQDLGELTGTTLFTVSRILSSWEEKGLIESLRQRVVILDPHALVSIAEDLPE